MTKHSTAQPTMFPDGADLPLFSGTVPAGDVQPYQAQDAARQGTMLDMRPAMGDVKPAPDKYAIALDVDAKAWGIIPILYMPRGRELRIKWNPIYPGWHIKDTWHPEDDTYYAASTRDELITDLHTIENAG